ncbi:MAG: hypothetical protein JST92_12085 [Deltaproteobacteria bacterium]|nr:hypothetical protein [Deltaproteobacteria bacterium]
MALCESVDVRRLPEPYQAEHFFTCAAAALAAFDFESATRHLKDSEDKILRPSSVRNYLFLAARLAQAQGEDLKAEALCREAAENTYTGQGGDGLVLWGDLLIQRGDLPGARLAWRLARERDPESAWAQVAKGRLV